MLRWIRRLTAPPVFPGDDEKTRVAKILNAVLWFTNGAWLFTMVVLPLTPLPLPGVVIVSILLLVSAWILVLLRAGNIWPIARLYIVFLWITSVVLVSISGGIVNPETMGFVVVILMAGLLLGICSALLFAGLSVIAAVVIYAAEISRLIPNALLPISPLVGLVIVSINIFLVSALLYLALSSLSQALQRARGYAHELEQERLNLEQRVAERTHTAEAARLEAETARRALEVEIWHTAGQVKLSESLRGEHDMASLANNVMSFLCHYLDLPVGVLFVRDATTLHLAGSYGRPVGVNIPAQFQVGEGMIGQVVLEKQFMVLKDILVQDLMVTSGLGQMAPREIMLIPLIYDTNVVGVIELGTLVQFTPQQLQFLERVVDNIAIAFNTAQARARMNELLMETQRQAEELQAQEEELRAANDDLIVQAESLRQASCKTH